jgi:hypothetical protein
LTSYAAAIATPTKYSTLLDSVIGADEAVVTKKTATEYRDDLETLYIIDELPCFSISAKFLRILRKRQNIIY